MAYEQKHKYGYRDGLEKGDPEKVIYGVHFDDEFEALEEELGKVFDALDPDGDNALLHEAPKGADQPWARDGEAQVWVLTVTFEQYQDDITQINENITTIEGDIATIQGDITTIQGDITTIQGDITTLEGDITDINQNITEIEGDITTIEGNVSNIINGGTPIAETDPTVPDHVKAITSTQVSNWNTAFGWGNHASAGYLTTFTETDPTVPGHVKSISQTDINNWNAAAGNTGPNLDGYATEAWVSTNYQPKGSYAASNHNHSGVYAPASHTHSEYAASNHNHDGVYQPAGSYAAANHTHTEYAAKTHTHSEYAANSHTHSEYAASNHNHSGVYAPASHTHSYVPLSGNSTISGTLTATDFVATSDMALKMNVERAETGLIDLIDGVTFDWKDSGKAGAGVLAQQIEKVLPDLVHTSDDGTKTVSYLGLLAYMIEEIKALKHGR